MQSILPNAQELVPNLGVLDKLLSDKVAKNKRARAHRETEQLVHYLRGACFALGQLERHRIIAAEHFVKMHPDDPKARWLMLEDLPDSMSYCADSFLMFLRRACDAVILYINRCCEKRDMPRSMNDLVKNIQNWNLDCRIRDALISYWEETGKKVRDYRDLASHHAIVLSNCLMFYHFPSGSVALRMLLPDDSSAKSPSQLRYELGVPAMGFFVDSLFDTVRFVNVVVERLIDLMAPDQPGVRTTRVIQIIPRGGALPLSDERPKGEPVPYSVRAADVVRRAVRDAGVGQFGAGATD